MNRIILAIILLLIFSVGCLAQDKQRLYQDAPLHGWYKDLKNAQGMSCCDVADCDWDVVEEQIVGNGYRVLVDEGDKSEWIDVQDTPDFKIIIRNEPNLAGHPVLCRSHYTNQNFCYLPGAGF